MDSSALAVYRTNFNYGIFDEPFSLEEKRKEKKGTCLTRRYDREEGVMIRICRKRSSFAFYSKMSVTPRVYYGSIHQLYTFSIGTG